MEIAGVGGVEFVGWDGGGFTGRSSGHFVDCGEGGVYCVVLLVLGKWWVDYPPWVVVEDNSSLVYGDDGCMCWAICRNRECAGQNLQKYLDGIF